MAGTSTPIYPQTLKNYVVQIANADASTLKTLVTGATNGTKIECINVTTTDTTARDVQLYITISAVDYLLGTVNIPANSGNTNALVSVNLLTALNFPSCAVDANGNRYVYVANGATLRVSSLTTVTSAKVINFVASGGDF